MESRTEELETKATSGELMEKDIKTEKEFGEDGDNNGGHGGGEGEDIIEAPTAATSKIAAATTDDNDDDEQLEKGQLSPLTGSYLLIVIAEPYSTEDRERIIQRLTNGLLTWDRDLSHVDLNCELLNLANNAPEGDEAKNGEKLVQWASENLVVEVLIHSQVNTLLQCMKNLLASFTRHRHIIHAGYTFSGSGSWILQDGTFSLNDFLELWDEPEVTRLLSAYKGDISLTLHCADGSTSSGGGGNGGVGAWTADRFKKESFSKMCQVYLNPTPNEKNSTAGHNAGVMSFVDYISKLILPSPLDEILQPSDIVGNIRFSHPTLYVFPGGHGDAALFGVNGFNMLIDGGFSRKACFWNFVRHLDRLDAVLLTRINHNSVGGLGALLDRKKMSQVFPQIGHFFGNVMESGGASKKDGGSSTLDENNEVEKATKELSTKEDGSQIPVSFINNDLLISLTDVGKRMIENLHSLNLKPQLCFRENHIDPINLYHKVGHGKLDLYVLNPAKDSRELKEFLIRWNNNSTNISSTKSGASSRIVMSRRTGPGAGSADAVSFPVLNLVSICALVVWQPTNPNESITRLLFPGSTPQSKIFEALGKLKHLEFLKFPVCSAESISAAAAARKITKVSKPAEKFTMMSTEVKSQLSSKSSSSQVLASSTKASTTTTTNATATTGKSAPSPKVSLPKAAKTGQNREKQLMVTGEKIEPNKNTSKVTTNGEVAPVTEAFTEVNGVKEKEVPAGTGPGKESSRPRRGRSETRRIQTRRVPSSSIDNKTRESSMNKVSKKSQLKSTEEGVTTVSSSEQRESSTSKTTIAPTVRRIMRPSSAAPTPAAKKDTPAPTEEKKVTPTSPKKTEETAAAKSRSASNENILANESAPKDIESAPATKPAVKKESKYGIAKSLSKASSSTTTSTVSSTTAAKSTKEATNKKVVQQKPISAPASKVPQPKPKSEPKDKSKPEPKEKQQPAKPAPKKAPVASTIPKPASKTTSSTAPKPVGRKIIGGVAAAGIGIAAATAAAVAGTDKEESKTNGTTKSKSPTPELEEKAIISTVDEQQQEQKQNGFLETSAVAESVTESSSELSSLEHVSANEDETASQGGVTEEFPSATPSPLPHKEADIELTPSSTHTMTDTDDDNNTPKAEQHSQRFTDEEDEYLVVQKSITDDESASETFEKVHKAAVARNTSNVVPETKQDDDNDIDSSTATTKEMAMEEPLIMPKDTIDIESQPRQQEKEEQQTLKQVEVDDDDDHLLHEDKFDMVERTIEETTTTTQPLLAAEEKTQLLDKAPAASGEPPTKPESIIHLDEPETETTQPLKANASSTEKDLDSTSLFVQEKEEAAAKEDQPDVKDIPSTTSTTMTTTAEMAADQEEEDPIATEGPSISPDSTASTTEIKEPLPLYGLSSSIMEIESQQETIGELLPTPHDEVLTSTVESTTSKPKESLTGKLSSSSVAADDDDLLEVPSKGEDHEEDNEQVEHEELKADDATGVLITERLMIVESQLKVKQGTDLEKDKAKTASDDDKMSEKPEMEKPGKDLFQEQPKIPVEVDEKVVSKETKKPDLLMTEFHEKEEQQKEENQKDLDISDSSKLASKNDLESTSDIYAFKAESVEKLPLTDDAFIETATTTTKIEPNQEPTKIEPYQETKEKEEIFKMEEVLEEVVKKEEYGLLSAKPAESLPKAEAFVEEQKKDVNLTETMATEQSDKDLQLHSKEVEHTQSPLPGSPSPTQIELTKDQIEEKEKDVPKDTIENDKEHFDKDTKAQEEQKEDKDQPEKKGDPIITSTIAQETTEKAAPSPEKAKQIGPEVVPVPTQQPQQPQPTKPAPPAKREVIRTPDEVAELPVHEVAESEHNYELESIQQHEEEGFISSDEDHGIEIIPIAKSPLPTSFEEKAELETMEKVRPVQKSPVPEEIIETAKPTTTTTAEVTEERKSPEQVNQQEEEEEMSSDMNKAIEKIDAAIYSVFHASDQEQEKPEESDLPKKPADKEFGQQDFQYTSTEVGKSESTKDDDKDEDDDYTVEKAANDFASTSSTLEQVATTFATMPLIATAKTSVVITPSTPPVIIDSEAGFKETQFKMPESEPCDDERVESPAAAAKEAPEPLHSSREGNPVVESPIPAKQEQEPFHSSREASPVVESLAAEKAQSSRESTPSPSPILAISKEEIEEKVKPELEGRVVDSSDGKEEQQPSKETPVSHQRSPSVGIPVGIETSSLETASKVERKVSSGDESSNSTASSTSMKTTVIQQSPASEGNNSSISQTTPESLAGSVVFNQFGIPSAKEVRTVPEPFTSTTEGISHEQLNQGQHQAAVTPPAAERPQFYVGGSDDNLCYVESPGSELGQTNKPRQQQQKPEDDDDDGIYDDDDDNDDELEGLENTPAGAVKSGLMYAATTVSATVIRHSPEHWAVSEPENTFSQQQPLLQGQQQKDSEQAFGLGSDSNRSDSITPISNPDEEPNKTKTEKEEDKGFIGFSDKEIQQEKTVSKIMPAAAAGLEEEELLPTSSPEPSKAMSDLDNKVVPPAAADLNKISKSPETPQQQQLYSSDKESSKETSPIPPEKPESPYSSNSNKEFNNKDKDVYEPLKTTHSLDLKPEAPFTESQPSQPAVISSSAEKGKEEKEVTSNKLTEMGAPFSTSSYEGKDKDKDFADQYQVGQEEEEIRCISKSPSASPPPAFTSTTTTTTISNKDDKDGRFTTTFSSTDSDNGSIYPEPISSSSAQSQPQQNEPTIATQAKTDSADAPGRLSPLSPASEVISSTTTTSIFTITTTTTIPEEAKTKADIVISTKESNKSTLAQESDTSDNETTKEKDKRYETEEDSEEEEKEKQKNGKDYKYDHDQQHSGESVLEKLAQAEYKAVTTKGGSFALDKADSGFGTASTHFITETKTVPSSSSTTSHGGHDPFIKETVQDFPVITTTTTSTKLMSDAAERQTQNVISKLLAEQAGDDAWTKMETIEASDEEAEIHAAAAEDTKQQPVTSVQESKTVEKTPDGKSEITTTITTTKIKHPPTITETTTMLYSGGSGDEFTIPAEFQMPEAGNKEEPETIEETKTVFVTAPDCKSQIETTITTTTIKHPTVVTKTFYSDDGDFSKIPGFPDFQDLQKSEGFEEIKSPASKSESQPAIGDLNKASSPQSQETTITTTSIKYPVESFSTKFSSIEQKDDGQVKEKTIKDESSNSNLHKDETEFTKTSISIGKDDGIGGDSSFTSTSEQSKTSNLKDEASASSFTSTTKAEEKVTDSGKIAAVSKEESSSSFFSTSDLKEFVTESSTITSKSGEGASTTAFSSSADFGFPVMTSKFGESSFVEEDVFLKCTAPTSTTLQSSNPFQQDLDKKISSDISSSPAVTRRFSTQEDLPGESTAEDKQKLQRRHTTSASPFEDIAAEQQQQATDFKLNPFAEIAEREPTSAYSSRHEYETMIVGSQMPIQPPTTTTTTATSFFEQQQQQYFQQDMDEETNSSGDFSDSQLSTIPQQQNQPPTSHYQQQHQQHVIFEPHRQQQQHEFESDEEEEYDEGEEGYDDPHIVTPTSSNTTTTFAQQIQQQAIPKHMDLENGNANNDVNNSNTIVTTTTAASTFTPGNLFSSSTAATSSSSTTSSSTTFGSGGNTMTMTTTTVKSTRGSVTMASDDDDDEDIVKKWGKPLGLPIVQPDDGNGTEPSAAAGGTAGAETTTTKDQRQAPSSGGTPGKSIPKKRSSSARGNIPNATRNLPPIYVDLAYVPHHGNSNYSDSEFFRLIRSRYYVFSGLEPSRQVFEGLLRGKQAWDDKNLNVTIIPTYDTDSLAYWVIDSEEALHENHIDLAPSASRCTINLQDHDTSCAAYRLEF